MSTGAYPISRLLQHAMNESGLSVSEFVQRLGYRNTAKGLRRLQGFLDNGCGEEEFLKRFVAVFHPDPAELERALSETDEMHQREHNDDAREMEQSARRRFKPFVWVHTEDGAHSFLTAVAERQIKVLWLREGFGSLSESERMSAVQARIRNHYLKTGGKYIGFGKILRYQLADTFDTSIVLDVEGNVLDANSGRFLLPEVFFALQR